jgi:hypothetical protein
MYVTPSRIFLYVLCWLTDTLDEPEGSLEVCSDNLTTDTSRAFPMRQAPTNIASHEISEFYDSTDLHMGMSLDDLLYASEFHVMPSN